MTEQKTKKRGWVKDAAIVFLVILLILTLFSNTIMNRTLPEVVVQYAQSGPITTQIRGTGIVTANEIYEVKIEHSRNIDTVAIRPDDEVSVGDVLFILAEGDSAELEAAREGLRKLQMEYQRALISATSFDYARENRDIQYAREELEEATRTRDSLQVSQEQLDAAKLRVDNAQILVDACAAAVDQAQEAVDKAQKNLDDLGQFGDCEPSAANSEYPAPEDGSDPDDYARCYDALISAQADLEAARNDLAQAEEQKLACDGELAALEAQKEGYDAAVINVRALERNLDDMLFDLAQQQRSDNKTSQLEALSLDGLRSDIEDAQRKIASLENGGSDTEVLSRVNGIVKTVDITAGSTPEYQQVLATIEVVDRGYNTTITVTAEQSQRVQVGVQAEVTTGYWGESNISATLVGIRNDPQSPQSSRILQFDVTGDVESGTSINLSIGERSRSYEVIVPNSAVRNDTNGNFVLVVEVKNSPLGNRYTARRVDVQVQASDDINSAVTGGVTTSDFVITTSTKPIESGMQVRIPD